MSTNILLQTVFLKKLNQYVINDLIIVFMINETDYDY